MLRLMAMALWIFVASMGLAQETLRDLADPKDAARAYLDACERWDVKAAGEASAPSKTVESALRRVSENMEQPETLLKELLCLPVMQHVRYSAGEPAVTGDECRIPVTATYTVPQTLVLRRQPDGTWKVDVHESVLSTTGAAEAIFARTGEVEEQADCLCNLKQIMLGILSYAQDHDEVLPHADRWCGEIMPYMRNEEVLKCPAAPDLACGYAFNAALSWVPLAKIEKPSETIVLFDSSLGTRNASGDPAAVPKPGRHNDGNNAAYVDGHAKWLQRD